MLELKTLVVQKELKINWKPEGEAKASELLYEFRITNQAEHPFKSVLATRVRKLSVEYVHISKGGKVNVYSSKIYLRLFASNSFLRYL